MNWDRRERIYKCEKRINEKRMNGALLNILCVYVLYIYKYIFLQQKLTVMIL